SQALRRGLGRPACRRLLAQGPAGDYRDFAARLSGVVDRLALSGLAALHILAMVGHPAAVAPILAEVTDPAWLGATFGRRRRVSGPARAWWGICIAAWPPVTATPVWPRFWPVPAAPTGASNGMAFVPIRPPTRRSSRRLPLGWHPCTGRWLAGAFISNG
ncbi:MAG: hypothetical protein VX170_13395, partial [Pseudomonadota bacterium]|nr:hypothetical protein [Pseudomonadota bacterium]